MVAEEQRFRNMSKPATKVPMMNHNQPFVDWRKEIKIWKALNIGLGVEPKIQSCMLYESLNGMPQKLVLSELTVEDIIAEDGVSNIVSTLERFYLGNQTMYAYNAISNLFNCKREINSSIENFLIEFQLKLNNVKASGTVMSDNVLGYTLLNCANLSEEKHTLVKLTCQDFSYKTVKEQIRKVGFGYSRTISAKLPSTPMADDIGRVKMENQVNSHAHSQKRKSLPRKSSSNNHGFKKPLLLDGSYNICDIALYADLDSDQLRLFVGETMGQALVDVGCSHTVAGEVWFKGYISSLSRRDRSSLQFKESSMKFSFGDGKLYPSKYRAIIPIYLHNCRQRLTVDVVKYDIPLLLSRKTLMRAHAKINIEAATINFCGATMPLLIASTGHLCLSLCRSLDVLDKESEKNNSRNT